MSGLSCCSPRYNGFLRSECDALYCLSTWLLPPIAVAILVMNPCAGYPSYFCIHFPSMLMPKDCISHTQNSHTHIPQVHTNMYTHHTYTHADICEPLGTHMHMCTRTHIYTYKHTYTCACERARTHTHSFSRNFPLNHCF